MRNENYSAMLFNEIQTGRLAASELYGTRDELLYVQAPALRQRYMELIGVTEEKVLRQELEVSLLRRKAELLQIAVNRGEPIDLAAIDAQLEAERQEKLDALESAAMSEEPPELTPEERAAMVSQYKDIVRDFLPALNRNLTQVQRELFDRAAEAYRHQDAQAVKLIHDALYGSDDGIELRFSLTQGRKRTPEELRGEYFAAAEQMTADYSLARELYSLFIPWEDDTVAADHLADLEKLRRSLLDEIDRIRSAFPFNAVGTLNDPKKTEEYLMDLRVREKMCADERERLEERIGRLTGGYGNG